MDVEDPAWDVPRGSISLQSQDSEAFFALAARVSPMVIEASQCDQNIEHPADILWVGNNLKLKRWDTIQHPCKCPEIMYGWESGTSKCLWKGYMAWCRLRQEYQDSLEEAELDLNGNGMAEKQHRARRDACLELDVDCMQA
ncbi:hypothetical protein V5O48_014125 [Marasmius crinis-equi]|uniref:Uncharacterized protein n=1 Tax=Marasmius crinis-equi TaxID=585013 RepID=A0ABR3EY74_9AGAR